MPTTYILKKHESEGSFMWWRNNTLWLQRMCPLWSWHEISNPKINAQTHCTAQNHIDIGVQYITDSTKHNVYVSSIQGKGAEGCKELLEAFEACVKGATAASWGVMHLHVHPFWVLQCLRIPSHCTGPNHSKDSEGDASAGKQWKCLFWSWEVSLVSLMLSMISVTVEKRRTQFYYCFPDFTL